MQTTSIYTLSTKWISILSVLFMLCIWANKALAQRFTYTPIASGCNGAWGTAACWTRTILNLPAGCTGQHPSPPPFNSTLNRGCQIEVVINSNLTITGNVTLGGHFSKLTIANGATLTINGNLYFQTGSNVTVETFDRGRLRVQGGTGILMDKNSGLTVTGDETGRIDANEIDFDNGAVLSINPGGAMFIAGETKLSGQDVIMNILGLYRTNEIDIAGKATLNMNSPGMLLVENRFKMQGQSSVLIRGFSIVEVGGQFQSNSNQITLEVEPTSKFYVCGGIFNPDSVPPAVRAEIEEGAENCRTLPLVFSNWEGFYDKKSNTIQLEFSIASQKGISHFEVQRSLTGLDHYITVDSIAGLGFSDKLTTYTTQDTKLPLAASLLYYRVVATSMEGIKTFSSVVKISKPSNSSSAQGWRLFPNPTSGSNFNLDYLESSNYSGGELEYRLIYRTGETPISKVRDLEELHKHVRAHLSTIPPGIIILDLYWKEGNEKLKILKN